MKLVQASGAGTPSANLALTSVLRTDIMQAAAGSLVAGVSAWQGNFQKEMLVVSGESFSCYTSRGGSVIT